MKPRRRQILEKLTITEISGVDRPCQEHARVTIMKRDVSPDLTELKARVAKLQQSVNLVDEPINKFWSIAARLASIAARRLLSRGAAAVSRRGRKTIARAAGRFARHEAKHAVKSTARHAVYGAGISAVAGAADAAQERARKLLEERRKKREEKTSKFHL